MRRILIFSLVYYPNMIGGAEVAIKEITDRIPDSEIEFDMVALRLDRKLPKFEKIGNVNIHRIGWTGKQKTLSDSLPPYLHLNKYAYLALGLFKAISLNRKRKYDAIWSLMATYNSFAAVLFKLAHPKIPFIFTLQDGDPIPYLKRRARPLYPMFKMMFTRADAIQAISKYLADWALDMGAKCPVTIVPNGVDYRFFSKQVSGGRLGALKAQLGKREGDIFLITVSRLVAKNAVGDIIQALNYLPINIKLLIAGTGYEEERLKKMVRTGPTGVHRSDRCEPSVIFLGHVPHADLPMYLQASNIFIRPSLSEGFGNSFVEAMAAGIPVIATPVGGIVDFLRDGETGLFCEVRNPRSIAEKVERLIDNEGLQNSLVINARRMVEDKYDWNKIANEMKMIFAGV
ncbi:glycosyltransferase family 4 protein [Patescibacteria group bacterium]|nr:glycosyltransferase family 4 protein [Patescibacteria group bacterium]MDE1946797.1 glycosyltransferase family 4 protein [Patescibacteria group bacterium]MDE2011135.1 glycosyltransferase family 4 protein [Patescibacteria group bacterium]MDE2233044.1 glycosyltransferase family 4 protein [Patescibacteria group bacterium]